MIVFHKLYRISWSSRVHRTESVSTMDHARSAPVSSIGSDQKRRNFFLYVVSFLSGSHQRNVM